MSSCIRFCAAPSVPAAAKTSRQACSSHSHIQNSGAQCVRECVDVKTSLRTDGRANATSWTNPSRRAALTALLAAGLLVTDDIVAGGGDNAERLAVARERRVKLDIPEDSYSTTEDGLKYFDAVEGRGGTATSGSKVQVHFEVNYRKLVVASSRASKLLGGNRTIAEPYDLVVGSKPGSERKREFVDSANGLYSAQAAPKPPRAIYSAVEGMRVGGKRIVIVPADQGYGDRGYNEIPPGATVTLIIDLLEIETA